MDARICNASGDRFRREWKESWRLAKKMSRLLLLTFTLLSCAASGVAQSPQASAQSGALLQSSLSPVPALQESQECSQAKAKAKLLEARLKDWPALARYRDDNEKVIPTNRNETRVVFLGDSITDSWDNPKYGGFFTGKPYINRGISGQTTPQMLIRFRPDVIAHQPKAVVILAGTNDIAGNTGPSTLEAIEDNLASMAELATAHGIKVILSAVMPTCDYIRNQSDRRPNAKIIELN